MPLTETFNVLEIRNDPPASPSDGDVYIIGTAPTGDWAGFANGTARWVGLFSVWGKKSAARSTGDIAFNQATGQLLTCNGTAWVPAPGAGVLDNNARVTVRKNTGADVGMRRRLNLIEGANVTLTVADDAGSEEVDVTIAASGGGGGGGGTVGTATLDFGVFPGASDASITVTGQAGILSGSVVEAWILPVAGADHTADEMMVETVKVFAGNIIAGTGFTIYGFNTSELFEPLPDITQPLTAAFRASGPGKKDKQEAASRGGIGTRIWGRFNVAWRWQ